MRPSGPANLLPTKPTRVEDFWAGKRSVPSIFPPATRPPGSYSPPDIFLSAGRSQWQSTPGNKYRAKEGNPDGAVMPPLPLHPLDRTQNAQKHPCSFPHYWLRRRPPPWVLPPTKEPFGDQTCRIGLRPGLKPDWKRGY